MSLVIRKPDFCICENKDADQLRGNCEADQRLCFCHMDSAIPLLIFYLNPKFQAVAVQPGLCRTWLESPKTVFHTTRLKYHQICTLSLLVIADEAYSALPKPDIRSINLENVYWSPSEVVGLSTPPPSQRNTPGPSLLETSTSSSTQHHVGRYAEQ